MSERLAKVGGEAGIRARSAGAEGECRRALEAVASRELSVSEIGGEAGIRTLGRGLSPYNGLANRRLQPLGHLTLRRACAECSLGQAADGKYT